VVTLPLFLNILISNYDDVDLESRNKADPPVIDLTMSSGDEDDEDDCKYAQSSRLDLIVFTFHSEKIYLFSPSGFRYPFEVQANNNLGMAYWPVLLY
jgi:hypothetical protein